MIRPRLHYRLFVLIALAAIWVPSSATRAEQPPATASAPAESKTVQPPRARPQVIYRVPRPSSYTANLHSQSKTQSHSPPIDSSTPSSPPVSRAPANVQSASEKNATTSRQNAKRPKMQSKRPQVRGRGPSKARGPGKSGKK